MLIDRYGRPVTHLRISVTNRCNHGCVFCHREGIWRDEWLELKPEDWRFVAETAVSIGIKYYKLTGGEPLIRPDIHLIVKYIREAGGEVSLVTNGSLLDRYAAKLYEAGLEHINISLHSLDPEKFYRITRGRLDRVLKGIEAAIEHGLKTKIDYVVLSWNRDEYREIIDYAERNGVDLNIIELIPLGLSPEEWAMLHVGLDEIVDYLEKISVEKRIREFQSRPTYILGSGVEVTVIRGICNPDLCLKCTRLRMTPSGGIKTCIYLDEVIDAYKPIVERDRGGLLKAFREAVDRREPFFKPGVKPVKLIPYLESVELTD